MDRSRTRSCATPSIVSERTVAVGWGKARHLSRGETEALSLASHSGQKQPSVVRHPVAASKGLRTCPAFQDGLVSIFVICAFSTKVKLNLRFVRVLK